MENPLRRIGILGHVGATNLGDEAIIAAVIQNLRERCPRAELCAFTSNPQDTFERHGLPAFPLRRGSISIKGRQDPPRTHVPPPTVSGRLKDLLKRIPCIYSVLKAAAGSAGYAVGAVHELMFLVSSYRHAKRLDLLIIAGSHQLNDFVGGPWAFPYTLLKWTVMARIAGARVAVLSVGAGPIDSGWGKRFVRWTLALACYRSYRDERSRDLVVKMGAAGENLFVPDLAFSLTMPQIQSRPVSQEIIGINPLPFFDTWYWYRSDAQLYRDYVTKMARTAEFVIDNGYAVWLFPTQLRADPPVIEDVRRNMRERYRHHLVNWRVQNFEDLAAGITSCRLVIATRYHGILMSLLLNTPVLALAYHGKSKDVMELLGQSKYALDAAAWDVRSLADLFLQLDRERHQAAEQIALRLPSIRRTLARQYDVLLGPIASQPRREMVASHRPESSPVAAGIRPPAEGAMK